MSKSAVPRWACVSVHTLPVQLVLQRHPTWQQLPVAVVAEDQPQSVILWVNARAQQARVVPGLRYVTGLSLAPTLRAAVVSQAEITASIDSLVIQLQRFSPEIEPSPTEPGIFWLNTTGVDRLFPSLDVWAHDLQARLHSTNFPATVVAGFSRAGTYLIAKARQGITIFSSRRQEQRAIRNVALCHLDLGPSLYEELNTLGVQTIGDFLRLPAAGLLERFGPRVFALHQWVAGKNWTPLRPHQTNTPLQHEIALDAPETEVSRLLFAIKATVHSLLVTLATRRLAVLSLQLDCTLDRGAPYQEWFRPAAPTLDPRELMDLIRIRLETLTLPAAVTALTLTVHSVPATEEQLNLFHNQCRRDRAAANRALARVRAAFGDDAVVSLREREGHLPEARFTCEPLTGVVLPQPRLLPVRPLIRRMYTRPIPLLAPPRQLREAGWLVGGLEAGPVVRLIGPDVINGGWWHREIQRDYYFAETQRGDLLWIYYDRRRNQWYLQGRVE